MVQHGAARQWFKRAARAFFPHLWLIRSWCSITVRCPIALTCSMECQLTRLLLAFLVLWLFQCEDCPGGCLTILRPRYAPPAGNCRIQSWSARRSKLGFRLLILRCSTLMLSHACVLSNDKNSGSIGACLAI